MTFDTTNLTTASLEATESDILISLWGTVAAERQNLQDTQGRIEMVLTRRMEADDATAIAHDKFKVEMAAGSPTWDYGKLHGILELIPEKQAVEAGAYIPEHMEKVGAKWNATRIRGLVKYSGPIADILKSARIEGARRLKITPKDKADG